MKFYKGHHAIAYVRIPITNYDRGFTQRRVEQGSLERGPFFIRSQLNVLLCLNWSNSNSEDLRHGFAIYTANFHKAKIFFVIFTLFCIDLNSGPNKLMLNF